MPTRGKKSINITVEPDNESFTDKNDIDNDELTETYAEFKKYIIVNNIDLQKRVDNSSVKIKELETEIKDLEEMEEKNDNRIRYMKGLLNNLIELKNYSNKISKCYKETTQLHKENYKNLEKIIEKLFLYSCGINFCLLFICFNNIESKFLKNGLNCLIIICGTILHKFAYNCFKNYKTTIKSQNEKVLAINKDIIKFNQEYKKLEESTSSLDNWISEI